MPDNTHVALREFIERQILDHEKLNNVKFEAMEQATELAFKNLDLRLNRLNELRGEVTADREQFVKADKYEVQHEALRKQVDVLTKGQGRWIGIAVSLSFISAIVGGVLVKLFG